MHKNHSAIILALIAKEPGLTDKQIAERSGISPVQQVNGICRRLAAQGQICRESGEEGKVVNKPVDACAATSSLSPLHSPTIPPKQEDQQMGENPVPGPNPVALLLPVDLARTLLVIPCSGKKRESNPVESGPRIIDILSQNLAGDLRIARQQVKPKAHLNESVLCPAWLRNSGAFYQAAYRALDNATRTSAHILILSGGYGVMMATEPIGTYNLVLKLGYWPKGLLGQCLVEYAQHHHLTAMVAFLASSTDYAKVVRGVSWHARGISQAFLVSPNPDGEGGHLVRVPQALGEAFSGFQQGQLTQGWSSKNGLALAVETRT